MKKRVPALIAVAGVLAAGAIWFANRGDADGGMVFHGNVDVRQVSLAFEGNGRIVEVRAEEGDQVRAGDVLAVLDTAMLGLETDQAQARARVDHRTLERLRNGARPEEVAQARQRLVAAGAEAERTAADLARLRQVSGDSGGRAVSGQEIDRAEAAARAAGAQAAEAREALRLVEAGPRREDIAVAEAQSQASEAALGLARYRQVRGQLRAPSAGVVRSRLMEAGDMASPQRPVFELALTSPKWVRIYVDEPALGRVRPGMAARVTTDSDPDRPVAGQVGYISSVAEFTPKSVETEALRTSLVYEVRVRVDDREGRLRLGQPVTVQLNADRAQ